MDAYMLNMKEIIHNTKESLAKKKGFISTTFLVVMCSLMSLILAKSNYIEVADNIYQQLEQYQDTFNMEAKVLNYVKCCLARNEELVDFYVDGIDVRVSNNNSGYSLYFDNYVIDIEVYEKQIVNFSFSQN